MQETVLPDICADRQADDYLRNMVKDGNLGAKAGKGFYDWTKWNIDEDMAKRDQFIIEAVKITSELCLWKFLGKFFFWELSMKNTRWKAGMTDCRQNGSRIGSNPKIV